MEVSREFYDAAMRLGQAVEELREVDAGTKRVSGTRPASVTEMRNRWRRLREEHGMKVDAALSAFRAAASADQKLAGG